MRILTRTTLLAALLAGATGTAHAAEGQGKAGQDAGAPTTRMGAGGLSGTGSTQEGARTGPVETKGQPGGAKPPSAPKAGTGR
ncbi:hypothetical protein [Methylobacterium sp. A52T]